MKRVGFLILAMILLAGILSLPVIGADEVQVYKIAILPFDDGSIKHWWHDYDLGLGVSNELITAFLNQNPKRFRVIEREQLDKILTEQDFGTSGRVDPKTAAKIGKILGVQYLLMGRVTEFSVTEKSTGLSLGGKSLGVKSSTSKAGIDARLVDTSTAEILTSVVGSGEKTTTNLKISVDWNSIDLGGRDFQQTDLGKALRDAVNKVAKGIADKAASGAMGQASAGGLTGSVAYASGNKVMINIGTNVGVKVGMIFLVKRVIEEVKDPDTGEVLDTISEDIAEIKVDEVKEKSATCSISKKISKTLQIAVKDQAVAKE
jgi:curli biogenesis system outer membrane secretion channel CsgG